MLRHVVSIMNLPQHWIILNETLKISSIRPTEVNIRPEHLFYLSCSKPQEVLRLVLQNQFTDVLLVWVHSTVVLVQAECS
jgi:hypothetical protein